MKILFLEPNAGLHDTYRNLLKGLSDKSDLKFFVSGRDLLEYFQTNLPITQEHIDLLISEFILPDTFFVGILQFIRTSRETYSNNNFRLEALPVLLYTNHDVKTDFDNLRIDLVVPKNTNENKNTLSSKISSVVKSWRLKIFDDLEVLGIGLDYDFSKIKSGYSVKVKSEKTKILSNAFLLKQQALPYLWLSKDFFEVEKTIDELDNLITIYLDYPREKLQRLDWEGQLQEFFTRNPRFIFQNNYSQFWSTPQINYHNSKRSIKPDLVAKPLISPELGKNWNIVDLKLPIQEFLQQTDFHKTFTAKFFKCLKQIKDYKTFFSDERNRTNIAKAFNFHPKNPKLTLIVGRRNVLLENQDILYQNLNEFNLSDVYLLTYDEIVDTQKRELERMMQNRLF
ncbi:MAG TPA: Shedu anti-phage system protein SduA domain-containing protein [Mucilaginibacter sp.]|jgi:hypothetical protein|nr:Shedu anti-phage system protein SduA domain-containing protein [Mucilaginibacter sp.]